MSDSGLPSQVLADLERALELAPDQQWRSAACDYGLVIQVLQAAQQALRQKGLHCSADQLSGLLYRFLGSRRPTALQGEEPPQRQGASDVLPTRRQGQPRRRVPRLPRPIPDANRR